MNPYTAELGSSAVMLDDAFVFFNFAELGSLNHALR